MMSMKNIMGNNKTNIRKVWENFRNKYENTRGSMHTVQKFNVFVFLPRRAFHVSTCDYFSQVYVYIYKYIVHMCWTNWKYVIDKIHVTSPKLGSHISNQPVACLL